jgi:hypothetical protein
MNLLKIKDKLLNIRLVKFVHKYKLLSTKFMVFQ